MSKFPSNDSQSVIVTFDSDHKCTCTHTAFDHMGPAGTGACTRCTCEVFKLDLDAAAQVA